MSNPAPLPPIERLVAILRWLNQAIASHFGGRSSPAITLAINLIGGSANRFLALAARVQSGAYRPRRYAPRGRPAHPPQPPRRNPLIQKSGWLLPLLPVAASYRIAFNELFRDPEVVAVMQAAPVLIRRILRPICWMLRLKPPSALARPRKKPVAGSPSPLPPRHQPPPPRAPAPPIPAPANTLGLHPIHSAPLDRGSLKPA